LGWLLLELRVVGLPSLPSTTSLTTSRAAWSGLTREPTPSNVSTRRWRVWLSHSDRILKGCGHSLCQTRKTKGMRSCIRLGITGAISHLREAATCLFSLWRAFLFSSGLAADSVGQRLFGRFCCS